MERRLLSWVIASTAFLFIYIALNGMFGPPRPAPGVDEQNPVAEVPGEDLPQAVMEPLSPEQALAAAEDTAGARDEVESWQTLGSFDPETGYRMLVYLNSRGAGIERIEMTERKANGRLRYRRVDVLGGYAGYMALKNLRQRDGVQVQVIGPGTPVALAASLQDGTPDGLLPGDVITAVNDLPVQGWKEFEQLLTEIDAGRTARLTIERGFVEAPLDAEAGIAAAPEAETATDEETPADAEAGEVTSEPAKAEANLAAEEAAREETVQEPAVLEFDVLLTEHPLDLVRLSSRGGTDEVEGNLDQLSCLLTLSQVGAMELKVSEPEMAGLPSQHNQVWDVVEQPANPAELQKAVYRLPVSPAALAKMKAAPVDLLHSYTLMPDSYLIDMEVGVENKGTVPQTLGYRLGGPSGITLEGWWYSNKISPNFGGAGARDVIYRNTGSGDVLWGTYALIKEARKKKLPPAKVLISPDDADSERELQYVGVDAQYFTVAYIPESGPYLTEFKRVAATLVADIDVLPKHQERAANVSFYVDSQTADVAPGEALMHKVRMFAGPKQEDLLAQHDLSDAIYYGWFPMIAKPLQWVLHFLKNNIAFNYAIAIVLLTLLVRMCMFPLGRRAAVHAQKMQELAPELKKISEKYKDDMEGRMKAQRELQQKAGFNPLSGCLPMFIQLPIFIGLYRCLSVDIELRQAALSPTWQWASNLAAPDMLVYWGDWMFEYFSGRGTGWLGPYFNILPMLVMGLFLLQQKMFMPPATDEQTAMTQKVMTVMTIFMGFLFFRVPSGLCIYFITSSLWGIAERKLVKKSLPPKEEGGVTLATASAGPAEDRTATNGSGGATKSFADRIRERMTNEPPPAAPPSKRKRPGSKKKRS